MSRVMRRVPIAVAAAAALVSAASLGVAAQDEPATVTIADISAGKASGSVTIIGSALVRIGDEEYYFSDGTDVIAIDIDTTAADPDLPLLELITIDGSVAADEIDVSSWAPLDIMVATVIKSPEEVMEAFGGWIIAHGQMAPMEGMEAPGYE